jgi:serine/threonine protein kinase
MEQSLTSRLSSALDEYMEALEAGGKPDRQAFLKRYPDLAAELEPCVDALDLMLGRDEAPTAQAPRKIGDFELVRQVGRGGMGVVYEAEQISLHRRVALKMLPFASILDPKRLQRFRNEAQAAAHLHHNSIVPVYSVGCERGVHHYAMQYIDGISVAGMIAQLRDGNEAAQDTSSSSAISAVTGGQSTNSLEYCRAIARLGGQAAEALDHAHEQGVVHRDIKPANLLLDTGGHVWITDFGLASFRNQSGLTVTGDLVGTVRYMSPEQALAKRAPIDHRTDVYSLGVTLYECVTLETAFPGEDPHVVIQDIALKDPVPPRRLNAAVPAELETILLKAMAKDSRDRYATAQELAEDLQRFLEDKPIHARRPSLVQRAAHWGRRHKHLVAAASIMLVVAFAGLVTSNFLIREQRDLAEAHGRQANAHLGRARDMADELLASALEGLPHGVKIGSTRREMLHAVRRFWEPLVATRGGDPSERHAFAKGHWNLGRILLQQGGVENEENGRGHYTQAIDTLRRLADEDAMVPSYRADLARVHGELGGHFAAAGDPQKAEKAFRNAIDEWKKATATDLDDTELSFGQALAIADLGDHLAAQERREEAIETWLKVHEILKRLNEGWRQSQYEPDFLEQLGNCLFALGILHEEDGNEGQARNAHIQAFNRRRRLHLDFRNDEQYKAAYAESYLALGPILARTRGVDGPPPPFKPTIDPEAEVPAEVVTTIPAPFEATVSFVVAGARPKPGTDNPRHMTVVHRGKGSALFLGEVEGESSTTWAMCRSGLTCLMDWTLVDRHGDTLVLSCNLLQESAESYAGEYIILSGTGRFAGAAGQGEAHWDESRAGIKLTFTGVIVRRKMR